MKVVHNKEKLDIDKSKKVYECNNCGKLFNWNENSSWYGSYNTLENNEKVTYSCSKKCELLIK